MKNLHFRNPFRKKEDFNLKKESVYWPGNFHRDWRIIVTVFAVGLLVLSVFAWHIYLSNHIAGGYLAPTAGDVAVSVKIINTKKLQADLLILETKQADYLKLKSNQAKLIDPSL